MLEYARQRTAAFQQRMAEEGIDLALVTDQSSIAYLAGFWGYLSVEFGRPTLLVLRPDTPPVVLTPLMESEMVSAMTWVDDVRTWEDAGAMRWEHVLADVVGVPPSEIAVEKDLLPAIVRNWLDERYPATPLRDISPMLGAMRMIKGPEEIQVMREAGRIAAAMMAAAEGALAEGVPEYEAALAVIDAGTRAAAGFLTERGWDRGVVRCAAAMIGAHLVIYGLGLAWLGSLVGWDKPVLAWGLTPFVLGDAVKLVLAAALLPAVWKLLRRP